MSFTTCVDATIPLTETTSFAQSPSIEDLLSARRKHHLTTDTHSVYSALSVYSSATETRSPQLGAASEERASASWSPALTSITNEENYDEGASFSQSYPPTPIIRHEDFPDSPSIGSVRTASRVLQAGTLMRARSFDLSNPSTSQMCNIPKAGALEETDENTPLSRLANLGQKQAWSAQEQDSSRRTLNARNLMINTSTASAAAARPYPQQLTAPLLPTARSAFIEVPAGPTSARSLPPPETHTASARSDSSASARAARPVSTETMSPSTSSEEDDGSFSAQSQASLQRMQSFLGPKTRLISPAPWDDGDSVAAKASSELSLWSEDDFEIGQVQVATKTPRSRSVREALGLGGQSSAKVEAGRLRGLSGGKEQTVTSRSSEQSTRAGAGVLSRSESSDLQHIPPVPNTTAATRVTNVVRTRSPEPIQPYASATSAQTLSSASSSKTLDSGTSQAVRKDSETATKNDPSPPVQPSSAALPRRRPPILHNDSSHSVKTVESAESRRTGTTSTTDEGKMTPSTSVGSIAPAVPPSKVPADGTVATTPNGLKLISLDAAREQDRKRHPGPPTPNTPHSATSSSFPPLPPLPSSAVPAGPGKAVKQKKSGFLRMFKKDAIADGNLRSPIEASPMLRKVSDPTDLRMGSSQIDVDAILAQDGRNRSQSSECNQPTAARPPAPSSMADGPTIRRASDANTPEHKVSSAQTPSIAIQRNSTETMVGTSSSAPPSTGSLPARRAQALLAANGGQLVPSLSLRPVSMAFSGLPEDFLANPEEMPRSTRTPETPSFAVYGADTASGLKTPPASGQNNIEKSLNFGLPTPPHSASSVRMFTAAPKESNRDATASAAYRARIVELERQLAHMRAELEVTKGGNPHNVVSSSDGGAQPQLAPVVGTKICDQCGCSCSAKASASILHRPRVVGNGTMFTSGRD